MLIALALLAAASDPSSAAHSDKGACAQSDTVRIAPADMLQRLDDFRDSLAPADRQRLDSALPRDSDGGLTQCDAVEGSRASCEAAAYMPALRSTGLMARFLATLCPKS